MDNQNRLKNAKDDAEKLLRMSERKDELLTQIKKHTNQRIAAEELLKERGLEI